MKKLVERFILIMGIIVYTIYWFIKEVIVAVINFVKSDILTFSPIGWVVFVLFIGSLCFAIRLVVRVLRKV